MPVPPPGHAGESRPQTVIVQPVMVILAPRSGGAVGDQRAADHHLARGDDLDLPPPPALERGQHVAADATAPVEEKPISPPARSRARRSPR